MVRKILRAVVALAIGALVVAVVTSGGGDKPAQAPEEKVILEMTMYPIQDSEGEYMLEYRESTHGPVIRREILKKDGKRYPVGPVGAAKQVEK